MKFKDLRNLIGKHNDAFYMHQVLLDCKEHPIKLGISTTDLHHTRLLPGEYPEEWKPIIKELLIKKLDKLKDELKTAGLEVDF